MCLDSQFKSKLPEKIIGYKVISNNKMSPIRGFEFKTKKNSVNIDTNVLETTDCEYKPYEVGFHVFKHLSSAKRFCCHGEIVYKVELTNIVAHGVEVDYLPNSNCINNKVYVGKRLKILDKVFEKELQIK